MIQANDQFTVAFLTKYPTLGARVLEALTPETTAKLLASCPIECIAHTIQFLLPYRRLSIFQHMPEELVLNILAKMSPSTAFKTLHFADRTWRAGILAKMDLRQSASVVKAFSYKEGSVGRFADPHVLTFTGDRTVSDAIQWIQNQQNQVSHEIYVVDRHSMLLGSVSIQELLIADIDKRLKAITHPLEQILSSNWAIEDILISPLWLTNHTLPVIDTDKVFLGVISYSSLLSLQQSKQRVRPEPTKQSREPSLPRSPKSNGKTLPHFMTSTNSSYAFDQEQHHPKS